MFWIWGGGGGRGCSCLNLWSILRTLPQKTFQCLLTVVMTECTIYFQTLRFCIKRWKVKYAQAYSLWWSVFTWRRKTSVWMCICFALQRLDGEQVNKKANQINFKVVLVQLFCLWQNVTFLVSNCDWFWCTESVCFLCLSSHSRLRLHQSLQQQWKLKSESRLLFSPLNAYSIFPSSLSPPVCSLHICLSKVHKLNKKGNTYNV